MVKLQLELQERKMELALANPKLATATDLNVMKQHPLALNPPISLCMFEVMKGEELLLCGCRNCYDIGKPFDIIGDLSVDADVLVRFSYRDKTYVVSAPPDFDPSEDLVARQLGLRINSLFFPGYEFSAPTCECTPKTEPEEWENGGQWIIRPDGETLDVTESGFC